MRVVRQGCALHLPKPSSNGQNQSNGVHSVEWRGTVGVGNGCCWWVPTVGRHICRISNEFIHAWRGSTGARGLGCERHGCRDQAPMDGMQAFDVDCSRCRAASPANKKTYFAAAICCSTSVAVTGPRNVCATLPFGSIRCVSGNPRGIAKSAGGSNGSTNTIG